MSGFKQTLKQYDESITRLEAIVAAYPKSIVYRDYLIRFRNLRDLHVANIGRK